MAETQTYNGHTYTRNGPGDEWRLVDAPSGGMILSNPAQPGQIQGQALTNQRNAATLPYEGPQAGATLARTNQAVQDRPFDRGDKLRADFDARQQVKDYRTSVPLLISALKTQPNAQGDNALVYAYAKIMDPNSVVRESEADTAASTAGYLAAAIEKVKKNFGWEEGRGLPAGAAAGLRREMNTKVAQYAKAYGTARRDFQDLATRQSVNPVDVVGRSPAEPFVGEYKQLAKQQGWSGSGAPAISGPSEVDPTGAIPLISPEDRAFLSTNARYMTPQAVQQWYKDKTGNKFTISDDNAQQVYDYYAKGGQQNAVVGNPQGAPRAVGEALATPLGTGVANYLNAASFGIPQLATGDAPFEALRDRNFKSAMAGDILGGITGTGALAGGLLKAGASVPRAATGANLLYGGAFGANTNEDNRLLGGAVGAGGALVGEGLGRYAVAPLVDAAVRSRAGQKIGGMFGRSAPRNLSQPEGALARDILPQLEQTQTNLSDAARLGLPMSIADASPAGRATLGAATRLDPVSSESIGRSLAERGLARNERASTALAGLAEPVDMRATTDEIFKAAGAAASPFYEKAYAQPAVSSDILDDLMRRPSMAKATNRARSLAAEEGRNPDEMGFVLNDGGDVTVPQLGRYAEARGQKPPSPMSVISGAGNSAPADLVTFIRRNGGLQNQGGELSFMGMNNAGRKGVPMAGQDSSIGPLVNENGRTLDDMAQAAWEAGYFGPSATTPRPSTREFLDAMEDTYRGTDRRFSIRDEDTVNQYNDYQRQADDWNAAEGIMQDRSIPAGQQPFTPIDAYGSMQAVNPTMQTLDYIKRGLDDVLESERDPITRQLRRGGDVRAMQDTRTAFRNELGNLNPDYKQGLDAYSGIIRRNDDLNAGFKGAERGMTDRDFNRSLANVVPENMDYFQRGYTTNLSDKINATRDGSNAYDIVAGTPGLRNRISTLFPETGPDFLRRRELEGLMTQTGQEVLGGSPTAGRLAAQDRFASPDLGNIVEMGASALTGVPPVNTMVGAGKHAAKGMFGNRSRQMAQKAAADIAPVLANPDPMAAASSLSGLIDDARKLEAYRNAIRAGSSIVGASGVGGIGSYLF